MRKKLFPAVLILLALTAAIGTWVFHHLPPEMEPPALMEHISGYNFQEKVLNSDLPVLVDFWAEWCGPCRMLAPSLAEVAGTLEGKVRILKVDADASKDLVTEYKVQALPTLILFTKGKEIRRSLGFISRDSLIRFLTPVEKLRSTPAY